MRKVLFNDGSIQIGNSKKKKKSAVIISANTVECPLYARH